MDYPVKFKNKMKILLAEEYDSFEASYEKPRKRGLRVNEYKISAAEFAEISPFPLEPIPWVKNGFFYPNEARPARHPYYAAGLYYLQEPSAMTPASRLPLEAGDRVLDLCAAPGGKATELAARLAALDREENCHGILAANDISQQRAKALLHNLEMTGTENYCVLNESPERLAEAFPQYFDKILVDAPCSGEGMFRKEEEALRLWSPERVADFAAQQKKILAEAYRMLRPGGLLLYSTCTFSPEENEQQIVSFLKNHPDMKLQEIEPYEGFAPGRPEWAHYGSGTGCFDEKKEEDPLRIRRCVRIWPHRMDGEGHFLALLKKAENTAGFDDPELGRRIKQYDKKRKKVKRGSGRGKGSDHEIRPGKEQLRLLRDFLCDISGSAAIAEDICRRAEIRQEKAFLPGAAAEKLSGLHVMRGGQYLGDWKKNRFEPSQAWAMTLLSDMRNTDLPPRLLLSDSDQRLKQYLNGETISAGELPDGWTLVCVTAERSDREPASGSAGAYPVGWAKVVRGAAKNHYPLSWRISG